MPSEPQNSLALITRIVTPKSSKKSNSDPWVTLRDRYPNRGVVLAIGAGLSVGSGIPTWKELLCRIGGRKLGKDGHKIVQNLIDADATLPSVSLGILESKCAEGADFLHVLRESLYQDFPFHSAIKGADQKEKLVKSVHEKNVTMRAVAALLRSTHRRAKNSRPTLEFVPW